MCLNSDTIIKVHTCITPTSAFDALWALLFSIALVVIKGAIIKYAIDGVVHGVKDWFHRHPLHRAHFWHVFNSHEAKHIGICEDGECKVIVLP